MLTNLHHFILVAGMGYASQIIIFYGCISYIVILAWAFLYFFSSFSGELPWATCNNTWNTGTFKSSLTIEEIQIVLNEYTERKQFTSVKVLIIRIRIRLRIIGKNNYTHINKQTNNN